MSSLIQDYTTREKGSGKAIPPLWPGPVGLGSDEGRGGVRRFDLGPRRTLHLATRVGLPILVVTPKQTPRQPHRQGRTNHLPNNGPGERQVRRHTPATALPVSSGVRVPRRGGVLDLPQTAEEAEHAGHRYPKGRGTRSFARPRTREQRRQQAGRRTEGGSERSCALAHLLLFQPRGHSATVAAAREAPAPSHNIKKKKKKRNREVKASSSTAAAIEWQPTRGAHLTPTETQLWECTEAPLHLPAAGPAVQEGRTTQPGIKEKKKNT
ncbi:hypothetical protein NDU88_010988 [Pleurodeles waltl]|uniref:Uncharacterized protein n=1 Tax=Pleurodeles waltl TaxID=8319 RepID=A0AAV7S0J0_PLEWA|nr:hypothetical protein NDU88_010988 [Pleurodeles waltl]